VELSYRGHRYELRVFRTGDGRYRVASGSHWIDAEVEREGPCERWLTTDGRRYRVLAATSGYTLLIEVEGVPHAISRADEAWSARGRRPSWSRCTWSRATKWLPASGS